MQSKLSWPSSLLPFSFLTATPTKPPPLPPPLFPTDAYLANQGYKIFLCVRVTRRTCRQGTDQGELQPHGRLGPGAGTRWRSCYESQSLLQSLHYHIAF